MLVKFRQLIKRHKKVSIFILLVVLVSGYFIYKHFATPQTTISYTTATVTRGMLISSISGTGQVSASNQLDIKAGVAGDALKVAIADGQEVKAGDLLVQLDASEAYKTVRDAENNLASAKLSLEKLKQPADELSILQAENSLAQSQEAKQSAEDNLSKDYDNGFTAVANAFLDLPTVMAGINSILYTYNSFSTQQTNVDYYADSVMGYKEQAKSYREDAEESYQSARLLYDVGFSNYKITNRFSNKVTIEALLNESYAVAKNVSEAIKSANNLIQFYRDKLIDQNITPPTLSETHLSSLNTYTGKINTHISSLLSSKTNLESDKQAIINADRTIAEKMISLADLKAGTDSLDLQSQELSVEQKENALLDARAKLADYSIRAPFAGVVTGLAIAKGEAVSSGTTIVSLLTKQKIAEVTLNEVDVAQVKVGQKVTLEFDAVSGLSVTGEIVKVDALGTVSQGVVSYVVTIAFDVQDERVKSGMSTSVNIIINAKQDVLMVPIGAVKKSGEASYVESLFNNQIQKITVTTGLSNDTMIEITEGLNEDEEVITQTISAQTIQNNSSDNRGGDTMRLMGAFH
jgi:HlyD family secretion protein